MTNKFQKGFTLVELAIVLVIIGLIIGGVLVGRDLIRTAELRQVVTEKEQYQAAVNTFRTRYNALPGDMRNATDIWGAAHATPATCQTTVGTGTQTCNGDGDGLAGDRLNAGEEYENYRFWQHLANANLIDSGGLTGVAGAGDPAESVVGQNVPRSSGVDSGGWHEEWAGVLPDTDDIYAGRYTHIFVLGADMATTAPITPVLAPADARYIDEKTDDGRPAQGVVRTMKGGGAPAVVNPDCADSAVAANAVYDTAVTSAACTLVFLRVF